MKCNALSRPALLLKGQCSENETSVTQLTLTNLIPPSKMSQIFSFYDPEQMLFFSAVHLFLLKSAHTLSHYCTQKILFTMSAQRWRVGPVWRQVFFVGSVPAELQHRRGSLTLQSVHIPATFNFTRAQGPLELFWIWIYGVQAWMDTMALKLSHTQTHTHIVMGIQLSLVVQIIWPGSV